MNCEEFIEKDGREAFDRIFLPRKRLGEEYPVYFACNMLIIISCEFIGGFLNENGFDGIRSYQQAKTEYLRDHSLADWEYLIRTTPIPFRLGATMGMSRLVLCSQEDIIAEARMFRLDHARFVRAYHKASDQIEDGITPACPICEEHMKPVLLRETLRWKCSRETCRSVLP